MLLALLALLVHWYAGTKTDELVVPSACSGGAAKKQHVVDVVKFYLEARALAKRGDLFDGANHKVRV
jgi:hypothetical protein